MPTPPPDGSASRGSFVPRPLEEDPGALRVPFFHRNTDYDEFIFYHDGLNPMNVLPAGEAVEWKDYWKSWMK